MPMYDFENKRTGEIRTVFRKMSESSSYDGENSDEKGEWERVYTFAPEINSYGKIDPFDKKGFSEKTSTWKNGGTIGDLVDYSRDLSEGRKNKEGVDVIQEKAWNDYSKARHGIPHPESRKKKKDFVSRNKLIKISSDG